nr:putative ribonuclease H-like domain-containing protein [Tanacetum cinerariifolium]
MGSLILSSSIEGDDLGSGKLSSKVTLRDFSILSVSVLSTIDGSLWSNVIQALYGKRIDFNATKFSSIWCSIIRELHQLKDNGFDFWEHCKIRIGNGSTTRSNDVCGLSNDGDFKVKDIRIFLDDLILPHSEPTRWIKAMPIKINIFAWRARKDCLPTRMNLVQRDINIDSVLCPVCVTNDEDAHHLFFDAIWHNMCYVDYVVGEESSQPPQLPIASTEPPQMVSSVKLPILKMDEAGNEIEVPPVTIQQILARTRERKAKSTLLMAIPDEHLAQFHGIKDAKTLWAQIWCTQQLDKEDLEQIDQDDLEEMDLKWQVAMISMTVKGNFARDYKSVRNSRNRSRDAGNAGYIGRYNGKRPLKEEDEQSLVVQDGLGTYDWSYQVEEEATDFALMAFTSNPSSSSSLNSEVQTCSKQCEQSYEQLKTLFDEQRKKLSKANIEIIGYQYGLELIEGQLRVHQQNEVIYAEKIRVLEYQVKDKINLLKYTQKQLDKALKEKEDLKSKLEKFETSSKNLTKLLDSQISAKVKTSLGYDSQFNEIEVLDIKEEEVTGTVFDNHLSDQENNVANDRFKKGEGYHAVPPPLTRNYMPPKPDLSFARLDNSIYKFKISETVTSLAKDEKDAPETSTTCYVWRPRVNAIDQLSKDNRWICTRVDYVDLQGSSTVNFKNKGIVDSGFSRHITVNKTYLADFQEIHDGCFVAFGSSKVTDDFSRFSWVFFLATKDETSKVIKPFLTAIENQINKKVKVIRCDNGTKFKNTDFDEFCGMKGIKREYSNARTPQQKGVAERKNKTLIEAARTMLADSLLPVTF